MNNKWLLVKNGCHLWAVPDVHRPGEDGSAQRLYYPRIHFYRNQVHAIIDIQTAHYHAQDALKEAEDFLIVHGYKNLQEPNESYH